MTNAATARFDCSLDGFVFPEVFEHVSDAEMEFEPTVSSPSDHVSVAVRSSENRSAIEAALQASGDVAAATLVGTHDESWRYHIRLGGPARRLLRTFTTDSVALLDGVTTGTHWRLRVVATDRCELTGVQSALEGFGAEPCCRRIRDGVERTGTVALTDSQRETLTTAFERGYYEIPRAVTAAELADQFDISHQALSERLRRAHANLVGETIRTN